MNTRGMDFPEYDGSLLAAWLELPSTSLRACALFAPCFTSGKDGLAASRISAALNAQGIAVLHFGFTALCMSEGEFANTNYFADPHRSWQRGSNENTNGLLRQYATKGTDLSVYSQAETNQIGLSLNARPRKRHQFRAPLEIYDVHLRLAEASVGTIH
jgi:hypothetical protein